MWFNPATTTTPPPPPPTTTTMNATSLLVSTSRLVFQYEPGDQQILSDLYRLVPYLRQSLSCTVCGSLLIEPYTPQETQCQHHVCRQCIGGRKNLKPTCSWCRDYQKYEVNTQLRILLQCYKNLCEYIIAKPIYSLVGKHNVHNGGGAGGGGGAAAMGTSTTAAATANSSTVSNSLVELIEEGARFQDNYKSNSGLLKSTYSILPCVYTTPTSQMLSATGPSLSSSASSSSVSSVSNVTTLSSSSHHHHHPHQNTDSSVHQQQQQQHHTNSSSSSSSVVSTPISAPIKTVSNGSAMYSVLYAGSGNKITIKRKTDHSTPSAAAVAAAAAAAAAAATEHRTAKDELTASTNIQLNAIAGQQQQQQQNFKKPTASRTKQQQKRKGCRCGNATPTPGKLTCCGQRCPCYVEAKSCLDCKCRGCRNPHRADGFKVRVFVKLF